MNDFGFNDYNALFQRMYGPKPEKDKAGWLDPAMTLAGTLAGLPLGPAGMAAGAGLGHAVGGAASSAVNGDATGAIQGASGIPQAWQMFAPYIGTFESGGPVREGQLPLWMQMAAQQAATPQVTPQVGPDMAQGRQMLEQFAGPAPTPFQPREASHPTLEMLASIIPQVLDAMPKPVKPNNRAIGTWLPAMSAAIGAPAKYAQARRKAVNEAGQENYDAQVEARNKFMAGAAPSVAGYLLRDKKEVGVQDRFHTEIPANLRAKLGAPPEVKTYGEYDIWWDKMHPPGSGGGLGGTRGVLGNNVTRMSDDALRQHAIHFAMTGEYLNKGARDPVSADENRRISNIAAQLFPGRQMALIRAAYKGNSKSMTEMVLGRDGIHAYAQSAEKNLRMMNDVLASIPEAGSEVLNLPLREFEQRFRGNRAMAAFNALRMSLNAEYSRLTQAMKLSGMGIPVDAQRETRAALSKGATVGQLLTAYQTLYEESNNRFEAMNAAVNAISERMVAPEPTTVRPPLEEGLK